MKKIMWLLVLSVLVISVLAVGVIAPGNASNGASYSCETDDDCVLKDKPYCCGNVTETIPRCYHTDETPKEVNCTGNDTCPVFVAVTDCECKNGKCKAASAVQNKTNCVKEGEKCCVDDVCDEMDLTCAEGYASRFQGCDASCEVVAKCVRVKDRQKITFIPWQKRNESECIVGCKCRGAVMSCPTESGKIMTIQAGRSGNIITITIDKTEVNTSLELEQERERTKNKTKLKAKLSNGETREVKIMPEVAAEKAREKLKLRACEGDNNCSIELKEIGRIRKELAYEVQAQRHAKLLGMFRAKMKVRAQINAENGEVRVQKPWWAFLATESEE